MQPHELTAAAVSPAGPWNELPGVTRIGERAVLPIVPSQVVGALAAILTAARAGGATRDALVARIRADQGGDRARLDGLIDWLAETRSARFEGESLSVHPGSHLQDLAFRLGAWAGVREVHADHTDGVKRWVHEVVRLATAHPDALRRQSPEPAESRAWIERGLPAVDDDEHLETPALTARLARILAALDGALLERSVHVRAVLLALLAGQHALLLGPPGTAKSLLARALCGAFADARYFEYLLSRFTHPDELFGPVSIPGLKEEDYRRLTEGFLPQAHVAFLDEVFKANSAILNSLLTLINERVFHHGRHRDPAPLLGLVGASNELPEPEAGLEALYDRFLVRLAVPPLGDPRNFLAVATGSIAAPSIDPSDRLTLAEVAKLRAEAALVEVGADVQEALASLWAHARAAAWPVSDRRWRQAVGLLKVAAAADGRDAVLPIDLLLLEPCLAWDPSEAPTVRAAILEHLQPSAAPAHDLDAQWILLWSDRVAPTVDDPLPPGDPPSGWRERLPRRRAAVDRFLVHHEAAVQRLGGARGGLEELGDRHVWLPSMPAELLTPHLEAARELAKWLRRAEAYRARLDSAETLADAVIGWLATEDRVRPEHMDVVISCGEGLAVGLAYKQWRRIRAGWSGPATLDLTAEGFLDWLDGTRPTAALLAGLPVKERRLLEATLPVLRDALAPQVLPPPSGDRG